MDRYDELSFEIMARALRPDSCCIDVGARRGMILDEIVRLSPEGRHHAFEPLPGCLAALEERYAAWSGVTIHPLALCERNGRAPFHHVTNRPAYSGLQRRRYDFEAVVEEIEVETARLDDVLPPDARVELVKIDVEGGELGGLRGGLETLRRERPIVLFEHGVGAADHYGTAPEQVYDLLWGECGLAVSLLDCWLDRKPPLDRSGFARQFHEAENYFFVASRELA